MLAALLVPTTATQAVPEGAHRAVGGPIRICGIGTPEITALRALIGAGSWQPEDGGPRFDIFNPSEVVAFPSSAA